VIQADGKLWQFFAVTVPATILVLAVYEFWRKAREARLKFSDEDLEQGSSVGV
jgi:hypothetical protein